ncbi:MAG TPA: 3-hydroxyacyl-CoA dehydrogenase family protein, partial [Bacteroidota bacterium]
MHRILLAGEASMVDEFASALRAGGSDVLIPKSLARPSGRVDAALELTVPGSTEKASALAALDRLPGEVPLFTSTLAVTLLEQSPWVKHRERLAGIGAYPGVLAGGLIEFALPSAYSPSLREAAEALAQALGKEAAFVQDLPGMVLPRIRCMLTNEACFALAEQIASAPDIDLAMKLGTNYPSGPLAWGEQFGLANVLAVIEALHRWYGEERYRPAPLLRRAAPLGSIAAAMAGPGGTAEEGGTRREKPGK